MVGALELAFSQKSLRNLCESQLKAERVLGISVAATLRARLADLRAAERVTDLVAGPPAILDDKPPGRVAIPLGGDTFIFFSANHVSVDLNPSKKVNWSRVSRIKILELGGMDD